MSTGDWSVLPYFATWEELHQIINCRNVDWQGIIELAFKLMEINGGGA